MDQHDEASLNNYPLGRGYGHDYMRGGEVFGGYGYADREEFEKRRGELLNGTSEEGGSESGDASEESPPGASERSP